jgi:5-methylcytosine-specific restriction protein B
MVFVTIKGQTFNISQQDIVNALERIDPEPLKGRAKYYIEYKGRKYPIKQVIAEVTGLPRVAFTAKYAYDILTKLGFSVKELK